MDGSIVKHDGILWEFFQNLCGILIESHWNYQGSKCKNFHVFQKEFRCWEMHGMIAIIGFDIEDMK